MTRAPRRNSPLQHAVVGREVSLFDGDLRRCADDVEERVAGKNLLIVGGAGSIGSSTIRTLLEYRPARLHVIDRDENGLAELVRSIRSSGLFETMPEMVLLPFDYGGVPFRRWLASHRTEYHAVLCFAALKHVRSEKDPYSILAMLQTNVLHLNDLADALSEHAAPERVFSVSTDKAANPSSMMGATKRLMEHALFSPTTPWPASTVATSARFANVAFSNGSLLDSWQHRLAGGEPLASPMDCRRYFVTIPESGHLCTLAATVGTDRHISVPALDPAQHLVLLSDVAERFLAHHGLRAVFVDDPDDAIRSVAELRARGEWPVLLTPLDTSGEKPYEEFVGENERATPGRFEALQDVQYVPPTRLESFHELIRWLRAALADTDGAPLGPESMLDLISRVEPAFAETYRASSVSLDGRM